MASARGPASERSALECCRALPAPPGTARTCSLSRCSPQSRRSSPAPSTSRTLKCASTSSSSSRRKPRHRGRGLPGVELGATAPLDGELHAWVVPGRDRANLVALGPDGSVLGEASPRDRRTPCLGLTVLAGQDLDLIVTLAGAPDGARLRLALAPETAPDAGGGAADRNGGPRGSQLRRLAARSLHGARRWCRLWRQRWSSPGVRAAMPSPVPALEAA